jgi:hypothetical protein
MQSINYNLWQLLISYMFRHLEVNQGVFQIKGIQAQNASLGTGSQYLD